MKSDRRAYVLSKDQPILQQARQRRPRKPLDRERVQIDFWRNFNLEKFACDWRHGVGSRNAA